MWLGGEARKGVRLTMALGQWGCRLPCRWARGGRVAWPHPMEHNAQPHQGDQYQLVEKERRDHGKTPSYKSSNEGIVPGFRWRELAAGWRDTTGQISSGLTTYGTQATNQVVRPMLNTRPTL